MLWAWKGPPKATTWIVVFVLALLAGLPAADRVATGPTAAVSAVLDSIAESSLAAGTAHVYKTRTEVAAVEPAAAGAETAYSISATANVAAKPAATPLITAPSASVIVPVTHSATRQAAAAAAVAAGTVFEMAAMPGAGAAAAAAMLHAENLINYHKDLHAALAAAGAITGVDGTAAAAAAAAGAEVPSCQVGAWGPYSACTRTGINQWSKSRSQQLQDPRCPPQSETVACDPELQPSPLDRAAALQQITLAVITAVPVALQTAISGNSTGGVPDFGDPDASNVAPADIAAGRALWLNQASDFDKLTCLPFNGHKALLYSAFSEPLHSQGRSADQSEASRQAAEYYTSANKRAVAAVRAAHRGKLYTNGSELTVAALQRATTAAAGTKAGVTATAGVAAVLATVAWDGNVTLGVKFKAGSLLQDAHVDLAADITSDVAHNLLPWALVQGQLPAAAALSLDASFNAQQQTVTFSSSTPDSIGLLSAIQQPLRDIFSSAPSIPPGKTVVASFGSLVVSTSQGVTEVVISLQGHYSPSHLSQVLGLPWALEDKTLSLAPDPMVLYNAVPAVMYVATTADMPAIGVTGMTATLNVQPGRQVALQLYGPTNPIPHLSIVNDLTLNALPKGGYCTQAFGYLAGLYMSVAGTITSENPVHFTMAQPAASELSSVVPKLFAAGQIPDSIRQLLQQMLFSNVLVTYSGRGGGAVAMQTTTVFFERQNTAAGAPQQHTAATVAIRAVPDVRTTTALQQIAAALGFAVSDFVLLSKGGGLRLGMQSPQKLQLPAPFKQVEPVMLKLYDGGDVSQSVYSGTLQSAVQLPGMTHPVDMQLTAGTLVKLVNGQKTVVSQLSALVLQPLQFDQFDFVQFGDLRLDASVTYSGQSPQLTRFMLSGPVAVCGVSGPALFVHDQKTNSLVFMSSFPALDLQMLMRLVGVEAAVGTLNAQLNRVKQSYADSAVQGDYVNVPAGIWFEAELEFLGMKSDVKFELGEQGTSFVADFGSAEFTKALKQLVVTGVSSTLEGALAGLKSELSQQTKLNAELLYAQQKVSQAANAYESAKKAAVEDLVKAQTAAEAAQNAVSSLRQQKAKLLREAFERHQAADVAYTAALMAAFDRLDAAKMYLDKIQTEYSSAVAAAAVQLEAAQLAVEELKSQYNINNSRCDAHSSTQQYCAAAASQWAAYQIAADAAAVATKALESVTASLAPKLAQARTNFTAAQEAATAGVSGEQYQQKAAAYEEWIAAEKAANALAVTGPAGTALQAANNAVKQAQQKLQVVVAASSTEWKALSAAVTAQNIASAKVHAAAVARTATAEQRQAAGESVRRAVADMAIDGSMQLSSLRVNFALNKSSMLLYLYYDMTVLKQTFAANFVVDLKESTQDLQLLLVSIFSGEAMQAVRTVYKDAQPFLL